MARQPASDLGSATPPSRATRSTGNGTILGVVPPTTGQTDDPGDPSGRGLTGTTLLDRYDVLEQLGVGGMAVVYRGRHKTIEKDVAIKVLRDEYADDPEAVARFLQEARAASRIAHENVVEITDFGETPDGVVFSVMELLHGENLLETIEREGALDWSRTRGIMLQICAALQAAHDAGVVHRDLKLENCFRIGRRGNLDFIKVLDFGIAKVLGADATPGPRRRTRAGFIVGTPETMAPEQARGDTTCDHRVDVYAAGAIVFELLTGKLPYRADSAAELLAMHLYRPVPDPRELDASIPAGAAAIVARAMAKQPDERFASMRDMELAIERLDARSPTASSPRSNPARALMLSALAVCGIAALTFAQWPADVDETLLPRPTEPEPIPGPAAAPIVVPLVTDVDLRSEQKNETVVPTAASSSDPLDAELVTEIEPEPEPKTGPQPETRPVVRMRPDPPPPPKRSPRRANEHTPRRKPTPPPSRTPSVQDGTRPDAGIGLEPSGKISEVKNPFAD